MGDCTSKNQKKNDKISYLDVFNNNYEGAVENRNNNQTDIYLMNMDSKIYKKNNNSQILKKPQQSQNIKKLKEQQGRLDVNRISVSPEPEYKIVIADPKMNKIREQEYSSSNKNQGQQQQVDENEQLLVFNDNRNDLKQSVEHSLSKSSSYLQPVEKKFIAGLQIISQASEQTTIRRLQSKNTQRTQNILGNNSWQRIQNNKYRLISQVVKNENDHYYGPQRHRQIIWNYKF